MQQTFQIESIGRVRKTDEHFIIELDEKFRPALVGLHGYSHVRIVWWGHGFDSPEPRQIVTLKDQFKKGPKEMGVFATRAPMRPNPILLSTIKITELDIDNDIITTPFIDAEDGTPVLDIKPYNPMERVRDCSTPAWCAHWPQWREEASSFDWSREINFK